MVKTPIKWHGGKSYSADRLVALMPSHLHYVEPFAGGLSVLLAKDYEGVSEVVNDRDGRLTNFWNVLRDEKTFAKFRRMAEATPFSQAEWEKAAEPSGDAVVSAFRFFVRVRQSLAGRQDRFAPPSRSRTRRGMNEQAAAWLTAVEGLPEVHARLKRVYVLNQDAVDVIRKEDGRDTLFYLDPPYHPSTRTAPEVYTHEMDDAAHRRLLDVVTACKGKVVLSGYDCPLYAARLAAWQRFDFEVPNHAAGGRSKRRMVETVWTNFGLVDS